MNIPKKQLKRERNYRNPRYWKKWMDTGIVGEKEQQEFTWKEYLKKRAKVKSEIA